MDTQKHIIIVGGGTAGWMAANLMAHHWRQKPIRVTVIEATHIGIIGVGEGSTPQLRAFFQTLNIDESEWMPRCNATYKNGISFHGWSDVPGHPSYFHPFPAAIDTHSAPAFFYNSHYRRQGVDLIVDPDRFFLSAYLAHHHKAPLAADHFPFDIPYGYHFDAYRVGEFLRDHALTLGVDHIAAKVMHINVDPTGTIKNLDLDNGQTAIADFFVDSTGFRSLLLQYRLRVPFKSFEKNLFNDAAVVMPTAIPNDHLPSQTKATALKNGWTWSIPLTNRVGNGYVYSSHYCSAEEAELELRTHLGLIDADVPVRHLRMKVGQIEQHWYLQLSGRWSQPGVYRTLGGHGVTSGTGDC